jgi:indolepyruvate ferredoxin oxidoreductase beta subunit
MGEAELLQDPYNVIITGVGGQGNVLASRVLGNMLVRKGYQVVIGETFGATQRGGSVMSHLRISSSSSFSPQIPKGKAHIVVALEPTEAIRVLKDYGSPEVSALCNTRPIHPVGVISGELEYPSHEEIENSVTQLTNQAWFINVTDEALKLGNPVFGNIMMIGALAGINVLPLDRDLFEAVISESMPEEKVEVNLSAYDKGTDMVQS